ncbi:MAG: hypothetical protein Q8N59_03565 [bacterium]|nr:hypothetical protein [bacterium]
MIYNCREMKRKIRSFFSTARHRQIQSLEQLNALCGGVIDHVSKNKCKCLSCYNIERGKAEKMVKT